MKALAKQIIRIDEESEGKRLDQHLSYFFKDISRSYIQKLIREERIKINGETAKQRRVLKNKDVVSVELPEPRELHIKPEEIPLEIIYEDDDLIVVNKPSGIVVHPGAGNVSGTLVNGLLYHCKGRLSTINGVIRPGIVHRIDKDTSGLLVVAKNDVAHQGLAAQLADHSVERTYYAVTVGIIREDQVTINAPIGRHPVHRKRMAVNENGKRAVSHLTVIQRLSGHTLINAQLETGRTHQIRVHLAYLGHPLLGDAVYGGLQNGIETQGQMLHAYSLGFIHPTRGERISFTAPLPEAFLSIYRRISLD